MSDLTFDAVDYLHAFADDATGCTPTASKSIHAIADDYERLLAELAICERTSQANANAHMATHAALQRLRADYRTLWGMTLGHDGQPPTEGTPDDIERLRALYIELDGTSDGN
jgi:hypothetical protein